MKNALLLLLLLLTTEECFATKETENVLNVMKAVFNESPISLTLIQTESRNWKQKWWEAMFRSGDDYLQALTLFRISSIVNGHQRSLKKAILNKDNAFKRPAFDPEQAQYQVQQFIASMATSNRPLSADSILLLIEACQAEYGCPLSLLQQKQIEIDGNNLITYLLPFAKLVHNSAPKEQQSRLLKKMANAEFADSYNYISNRLVAATLKHVEQNPVPEAVLEEHAATIGSDYNTLEKSHKEQDFIMNNLISIHYSFNVHPIGTVYKFCENNPEQLENCLKLSNLLIKKSGNSAFVMMGHNIKATLLQSQGKLEQARQVKEQKKRLEKQLLCVLESIDYFGTINGMSKPVLTLLYLSQRKTNRTNEFADIKQRAYFIYQQRKVQNLQHLTDPHSCLAKH